MRLRNAARVITIVLMCMMLVTGCASAKLSLLDPGSTNQQTNDTEAQQSGAIGLNDASASSAGTDAGGTVSDGKTNENNSTTGSAIGSDKETSSEQTPATGKAPVKVKALYLTGWTVGSTKKVDHYINLAKTTEINSYVIDIKDDDGYVGYESNVPAVKENGTWKKKYDADSVIKAFHDNNVHLVGRIVAFKDPVYSLKRPDLAIKNVGGGLWKDNGKLTWLNPYNKENWDYLISIAKEAVSKGFDEIQFDYVRFPSDGKKKNMDFSGMTGEKYKAIGDFLAYAKSQISVPVSADVFGIILESPADTEGIGQYLEHVGKDVDYISPMVYPSHYAYGQIVNKIAFKAPDLDPYGVVYNTLVKGKDRISKVSDGYNAKVRPYLQDFTASWLRPKDMYQTYGSEQVRQQIKAVYDAGFEEWILWDAGNSYDEAALLKENS